MARVLIRTQAWGSVTNAAGLALSGLSYVLKNTDGSAATHWSAETGGSSSSSTLTTDADGGAVLSSADRWIETGEYDLTVNGKTYRVHTSGPPNTTVLLDSYYGAAIYASKSASINAAVAATQALGGTLEFSHGRIYSLDTAALQIAPGSALTLKPNGATLQANWGKPRCIDFGSTSTPDYSTFQDIDLGVGLICDANNLTSSNHESIVGNLFTGSWGRRINATRIKGDLRIINAPVGGGAIVYEGFALGSRHLASGETRTNLTEIRIRVRVEGCDVGFAVIGTGVSGATNAGVEVYHDQIYYDVTHDTGVVPTNTSSGGANVQIGSVGWGDYCEGRVSGANSGDVGVEIDGMMTSICTGTVIDAKNCCFYARNFHPPRSVTAQKNTFRNTVAISRNVDKGTIGGTSKDYAVGGDSTASFAFGEIVFDNAKSQCETALASWSNSTAMFLSIDQMYVRRVKVIGTYKIGCTAMAQAGATSTVFIYNNIWVADPRGIVEVDGIALELAGTLGVANSGIVQEALRLSTTGSQTTKVDIGPVTVDTSAITSAATNNTLKCVHAGVNASSFFTGRIRGVKATNGTVGSWTALNLIAFNANFHAGGTNTKFLVEDCDSALWTSSAGSDYSFASNQFGMINIRSIAGRRSTGAPFGVPTAITPGASPYTYQNGDGLSEEVIVSGGTVSDISISHDNSTFFTLGQTAGKHRVESGDYLKVTYTVAPTMTKIPLA